MKVRIVSDGTPAGTQVFDENGVDLMKTVGVSRIVWTIEADRPASVVIEGDFAEVDVVAEMTAKEG